MNSAPQSTPIKNVLRDWRERTASLMVKILAVTLLGAMPVAVMNSPVAHAATSYTSGNLSCDTTGDDSIKVTASHGKAFYVDGTQATASNDIDASYIGYQVTNSGTAITNAWVKISGFGETVTAATSTKTDVQIRAAAGTSDKLQIASLDNALGTDTRTAFFLLKANNVNSWGNSDVAYGDFFHTVTVYNGNPDLGGTIIRQCTYKFTKVTNTIAAAANKVTSITASKTAPRLGETFTVTAVGQTGTIGAGEAPDNDIIWLSAAPYSSFPLSALRLERVSFKGGGSGACWTSPKINQLLIPSAASSGCAGNYEAVYTFKAIGPGPSNSIVAPVAQIASGTQIKHTTVSTISLDLSKATVSNISIQKGVESKTGASDSVTVDSINYARVVYVETASVTTGSGSLDFLVDSPTAGAILQTTTANGGFIPTYKIGSASAVQIIPTSSGGKYYFQGPFNFTSSSPLVIRYSMLLPINGSNTTYSNTIVGNIGGREVSASAGVPLANVEVTPTGGTTVTTGYAKSAPGITTVSPTSIGDTSAYIHGTVDAVSETTTVYFQWGTSSSSLSYTTDTATTLVTISDTNTAQAKFQLTGLTPGTTYYYRYVGIGDSGLRTNGEILSFKAGLTFVNTTAATAVRFTTATLNGNFSDIRVAGTRFRFYWSTDSAAVSARTSDSATVGISTATGSGASTDTSTAITGLTQGTLYYFMLAAESVTAGTLYDTGDILQFTTGFTQTDAATSITQTGATLNGSLFYRDMDFASLDMKFIWGTTSNLLTDTSTVIATPSSLDGAGTITYALTGLTAGTTYYFRAVSDSETVRSLGSILSFTTSAASSSPAPSAPAGPSTPPVVITWPTPGPLTYPSPLGGTQLNATATCNGVAVTGTYVYTPALGTVLDPGTYTLLVTFVPASGSACGSASTTVRIVVTAPSVTITWPNPPAAQGPVTLGPTQLNAVCSVPGTLTYDPATGKVLPVGTYTLKVTCTPNDPKLSPVSTTVPFVVVTELAKITWPTPAPQSGPLRLTVDQLNAKCSVPGVLKYEPALGTVLQPGTYTLKVTCIPTDPKIPSVTTTVVLVINGSVEAPQNAKTSPITFTRGSITWEAAKNAVSYTVDIRGEQVCATNSLSCTVPKTIGPKTPVIVTAIGKDKKTASARAVYFNDKLLTAIEVNFATNSYFLNDKANKEIQRVSAIIKREGFTIVEITGHTDPRGGALNVPLSNNRSEALKKAMLKLVPYLEITNAGLSYDDPKASNATKAGMAANRRSVGAVK